MPTWKKPAIEALLGLSASILGLLSCSQANESLTPLELNSITKVGPTSLQGEFCTQDAENVKPNLKFIFVIDKSGSNQTVSSSSVGTDPDGARRYVPLQLFSDSFAADPSVFFSLVNLSTAATTKQSFTNDVSKFKALLNTEYNSGTPVDAGWTNFQSSLEKVKAMIAADIAAAKVATTIVASSYVIFFISDGAPVTGTVNGVNQVQAIADLVNLVKSIIAQQEDAKTLVDSIQLHTGYYFGDTEDPTATEYMRDLAAAGRGDFYQFSAGNMISYSQFALPTRKVKRIFRDVFLEDLNTVWNNGELQWDSDGDGISDMEEARLGSNPQKDDSDNNAISDGVELYAFGKPCESATCTTEGAKVFSACNSYKPTATSTISLVRGRIDPDKDFLNSCEEQLVLKSDPINFDSNDDWIPEGLAFRKKLAFIAGENETSLDPDADGISNYNELKIGTPLNYANASLLRYKPIKYQLQITSDSEQKTCYKLKMDDISVAESSQKFRLYVLESAAIVETKRYMRTLDITLNQGQISAFLPTDLK
jgi:uncharacterized protein YegL